MTYLIRPKFRILSLGFHVCFSIAVLASKVMRVSVSELREDATIANFGGTSSPTPRTFTRRPSRHPNLGLEKGIHILPNRAIGFYPTSYGQMNALSHALGTNLTCNRSVCDPACGPSRRIADLLRLLQPSRIFCMDANPSLEETGVRISSLENPTWCALNLGGFDMIVTSLPYRHRRNTTMLGNIVNLLSDPTLYTFLVAVKMLTVYDSVRQDRRDLIMRSASMEIKLAPVTYPGFTKPFPWPESWFVFHKHRVIGSRAVVYPPTS